MKRKIGYWTAIGLFSIAMMCSALGYLSGSQQMVDAFRHLGYPDYFRTLLGVAKLLGVAALLAPHVPVAVGEWAYAGFGITMIAAAISHVASGDSGAQVLSPLIALALLVLARALWQPQVPNTTHSTRHFSRAAPSIR